MAKYYFVGTILPALTFDVPPEITFAELKLLLSDNLSERDYAKVVELLRFYDILNLRALWLGEEFDHRGAMSTLMMGEALVSRIGLPDYVYDFVEAHEKPADKIRNFPLLLAKYFQEAKQIKDPFLHSYLNFERELRLVLTAFRAKKLGRDLSVELQFEDPEEELIAQMLAQKDAKEFEPPEKYKELKILFEKYGDNPLVLQKALDEYRFNAVDSFVELSDTFSIERMLSYLVQLTIVKKWSEMDKAKGLHIVDTIAKEM